MGLEVLRAHAEAFPLSEPRLRALLFIFTGKETAVIGASRIGGGRDLLSLHWQIA